MATSQAIQRARSADQKLERRQTILEAANTHLLESGFEAFSMAALAKSLGLAKGTLYLYFHTREEVLLALSEQQFEAWANRIRPGLSNGMTDEAFCELLFCTAQQDQAMLPLMMRLNAVIEHNVSIDALVLAKRSLRSQLASLTEAIAPALSMTIAQSMETLSVLGPFLIGAAQTDKGPTLEGENLPTDVRDFMRAFDAHQIFVPNACHIIRGIRSGNQAITQS